MQKGFFKFGEVGAIRTIGFTLKFGNDKKPSLEFGMIDSNPTAPYNSDNSIKLYDSKDTYNLIVFLSQKL